MLTTPSATAIPASVKSGVNFAEWISLQEIYVFVATRRVARCIMFGDMPLPTRNRRAVAGVVAALMVIGIDAYAQIAAPDLEIKVTAEKYDCRRMNRDKVKINWNFDRRTARRKFGYNRKSSRGQ